MNSSGRLSTSAIGAVPAALFTDNDSPWSGDHCMDHTSVPGILFTNQQLRRPVRKLGDLGAAILEAFASGGTQ